MPTTLRMSVTPSARASSTSAMHLSCQNRQGVYQVLRGRVEQGAASAGRSGSAARSGSGCGAAGSSSQAVSYHPMHSHAQFMGPYLHPAAALYVHTAALLPACQLQAKLSFVRAPTPLYSSPCRPWRPGAGHHDRLPRPWQAVVPATLLPGMAGSLPAPPSSPRGPEAVLRAAHLVPLPEQPPVEPFARQLAARIAPHTSQGGRAGRHDGRGVAVARWPEVRALAVALWRSMPCPAGWWPGHPADARGCAAPQPAPNPPYSRLTRAPASRMGAPCTGSSPFRHLPLPHLALTSRYSGTRKPPSALATELPPPSPSPVQSARPLSPQALEMGY